MHSFITDTALPVGVRYATSNGARILAITVGGRMLSGRSGPLTVQYAVVEPHPSEPGRFLAFIRDVRLIPAGAKPDHFIASGASRIEAARAVVQAWRNAWEVLDVRPRCHYGKTEPKRGDHGTEVRAVARVRLVWAFRDGSGVSQYDADMCAPCLADKRREFGDPEEVAAGSVTILDQYV